MSLFTAVVTTFSAVSAVIIAIFAESHIIVGLAKRAVSVAFTMLFSFGT
jgi:hypothetical protein